MAVSRASADFGGKLRAARERRGLSLRQIANATKISVITLEALERNDITRLPGGIFGRAFVRSYAVEVGLDPEETIQEFLGQFPHDSVTVGHPATSPIEDHEAIEGERRMATTFLRLFAISVPIAAVVLYFSTAGRRASPPADRPATVAGTVSGDAAPLPAQASGPVPAATAPVPRDPPTVPADRLMVQLTATRQSWVSAIVDGRQSVQRLFQPGDGQAIEVRNEMVLKTGNAGAITMTLNGAATRPLGKDGEVVTTRITLLNFKDYLVTP